MTLYILRHGESEWNKENKFTGWTDVNLSKIGQQEALTAGLLLKDIKIDFVSTSKLSRTIETFKIIASQLHQKTIKFSTDFKLV